MENSERLTHIDEKGNAVMVDVSEKSESKRTAEASGRIYMSGKALDALCEGTAPKGDVLGCARVAGIMAAKNTGGLIPLCHPLRLSAIAIDFETDRDECSVICRCRVSLTDRTGAEMEALTGVSVALLTVYDMLKAVDKSMEITNIRLDEKTGGKSGAYRRTGI